VPGDARGLLEVLPAWGAFVCQATLILAAIIALGVSDARIRLGAALLGVAVVALAVAAAGDALTPTGNKVVRVAPGAAVWVLLLCLGLMATDAITRMRPGPLWRVLFLVGFIAIAGLALAHGTFDHLSVMREYAVMPIALRARRASTCGSRWDRSAPPSWWRCRSASCATASAAAGRGAGHAQT